MSPAVPSQHVQGKTARASGLCNLSDGSQLDGLQSIDATGDEILSGADNSATETMEDALEAWEKIVGVSADIGRYLLKSRIISARKRRQLQHESNGGANSDCAGKKRRKNDAAEAQREESSTETSFPTGNAVEPSSDDNRDLEGVRAIASLVVRLQKTQRQFGNDIRNMMASLPSSCLSRAVDTK